MLLRDWYCLQVAEKKEDKTVTRIYQVIPRYLSDEIIEGLMFKVPRDENGKALYLGYVFLYCELTPDIVNALKEVPLWIRFLSKVDYSRRKKLKGKLESAYPVIWSGESATVKDAMTDKLGDEKLNEVVVELDLVPDTIYKIQGGPFKGFTCMFRSLEYGERKAIVIINLLGRATEMKIDVQDLREDTLF